MSVLDQILQSTRRRVEEARAGADLRELERSAGEHEVRGFRRRLVEVGDAGVAVVWGVEKGLPSQGMGCGGFLLGGGGGEGGEVGGGGGGVLFVLVEGFVGGWG